jgi:hypothetical protein
MWTGKDDESEPIRARRIVKNGRGPYNCDFGTVGSIGLPFYPEDGSNMFLRNFGNIYQTTERYIPGDSTYLISSYYRENLRYHRVTYRLSFKQIKI